MAGLLPGDGLMSVLQIKQSLVVGLGGAIGAVLRWRLASLSDGAVLPVGTLTANLAGCFILGMVLGVLKPGSLPYLFAVAGFCGALTTFSTFVLELAQLRGLGLALGYGSISVLAGLGTLLAGQAVASKLF